MAHDYHAGPSVSTSEKQPRDLAGQLRRL